MSRHWKYWGAVLCAAAVSLCFPAWGLQQSPATSSGSAGSQLAAPNNAAQQPASPTTRNATPPPTGTTASDSGAQIDELMKHCNEAMNIKVQFHRAEELARQALDLSEKAEDKARASTAMVYLASALAYQGRLVEALEVAEKSVALAHAADNKKILEQALNTVASVNGELGRYEESLRFFYECLDLARQTNDPVMQYMSLLNIGEAYVRSGDPDKADQPLQESLRLARGLKHSETIKNPSKKGIEMALLNLGAMEMACQHYKAALNYYQQVHASQPESALWVISALQGMAESYEQLGQHQEAIDLLEQAIPISEKATSGLAYAKLLSHLGANQEALGQLDLALATQNRALALTHQVGSNPDYEWQIESRIAHVERALGRNDEALQHYRKSVAGIELLRSVALNTEEGRAGVLERSRATYAEMADLLCDLHRESEALEIAEHGRARAFLDMLAESRVGITDELNPEQRKREDAISARISQAQKDLWKEKIPADDKRKYETELTLAEEDLEALHIEVRQNNPRYASVQYPEPVSVREIQSKLLTDHTALIEYLLGEKRSLVWVVTKDKLTTAVLPARKDIEERVAAYRKLLSERASALTIHQSAKEISRLGAKLYSSVFQPIETAVASCGTLIIVPDGSLAYLPFEALVVRSAPRASGDSQPTYLIEKYAAVYGPSASALVTVQAMNHKAAAPPKMLLAFGDPVTPSPSIRVATAANPAGLALQTREGLAVEDYAERGFSLARLPYTRDEVLAISNLFPLAQRRVYLGAEAREEAVKSEKLNDFRFIHFATHGFLDETRPGRSGILLSRAPQSSEDGILQMGEIMRLKMNADLVTLSACSTGLGKLVNGEGILGLTRAFFYAGARNVAVTLWNVNDSATATLMASFYRHISRGVPKNEALRQAKLSLLHSSQPLWHHPYFWAAFVIEGEGH